LTLKVHAFLDTEKFSLPNMTPTSNFHSLFDIYVTCKVKQLQIISKHYKTFCRETTNEYAHSYLLKEHIYL
jgi:hypothetical protein